MLPLNPDLAATFAPPVMEARRWLDELLPKSGPPLINVSQAAPVDPPPDGLRRALAEAALNEPQAHLYGPVLGMDALREALAARWTQGYGGPIGADNIAITQGCNQAFCAAIASIAQAGDEIILQVPWYFNYKMWADMQGYRTVPLHCGEDMVPRPEDAARLITSRSKAIVLVTPNNPSGAEYPAGVVRAFFELAREHGLALILDETYRDFDSRTGPSHDLFQDPDWGEVLIHLYSFSKAYRLTGHRVGAITASTRHLGEIEKVLDCLAICAPQLGQIGALWGLNNLDQWLAGERDEILARRAAMTRVATALPAWKLKGCGAYFAWLEHPFGYSSDEVARRLVASQSVLALPGTMFAPQDHGDATRHLRIAFANVDIDGIEALGTRLAQFRG